MNEKFKFLLPLNRHFVNNLSERNFEIQSRFYLVITSYSIHYTKLYDPLSMFNYLDKIETHVFRNIKIANEAFPVLIFSQLRNNFV